MKRILFLLLLLPLVSFGQGKQSTVTVLIKAGTSAYWTLNGQDFPRGMGFFTFGYFPHTSDTAFNIVYGRGDASYKIPSTCDTFFYYVDSSKFARNATQLQTWLRTNAY